MLRIACIGAGNMGGALIEGLLYAHVVDSSHIFVADHNSSRQQWCQTKGIQSYGSAQELFQDQLQVDITILALKPQILPSVVKELSSVLATQSTLVISVAIGLTLHDLSVLSPHTRFCRMMPNLPVAHARGAMGICAAPSLSANYVQEILDTFSPLGSCLELREDQLEAMGSFVGTAPAFFAMFVDCLTRSGIRCGVPAEQARQLLLSTMEGTAHELLLSNDHPRVYMEKVCSPGGSTIAALAHMEPGVMRAIDEGVMSAYNRAQSLGSS